MGSTYSSLYEVEKIIWDRKSGIIPWFDFLCLSLLDLDREVAAKDYRAFRIDRRDGLFVTFIGHELKESELLYLAMNNPWGVPKCFRISCSQAKLAKLFGTLLVVEFRLFLVQQNIPLGSNYWSGFLFWTYRPGILWELWSVPSRSEWRCSQRHLWLWLYLWSRWECPGFPLP